MNKNNKNYNIDDEILAEYIHLSRVLIDDCINLFEKITLISCLSDCFYDKDSNIVASCLIDTVSDLYAMSCNTRVSLLSFSNIHSRIQGFEEDLEEFNNKMQVYEKGQNNG